MIVLVLLAVLFSPYLYGMFCAILIRCTPTLKWKLKLGHFLIAKPTKLYGNDAYIRVCKDVEILIRWKCGSPEERLVYDVILKRGG